MPESHAPADADRDPAQQPVTFSAGLGETILPEEPESLVLALANTSDRDEVEVLVAASPTSSLAWAALGDLAESPVQRYAAYRVGYHRGLDALRANGWRGSGYVREVHPGNRGFLRCLVGLYETAQQIGEDAEATRVSQFAGQLDPDGVGARLGS